MLYPAPLRPMSDVHLGLGPLRTLNAILGQAVVRMILGQAMVQIRPQSKPKRGRTPSLCDGQHQASPWKSITLLQFSVRHHTS